jgi:hypothetical protein
MPPFLQPALLAPPPALEITDEEYSRLKAARPILSAAFSLEENYDLLIGNFVEFEKAALAISMESVARVKFDYEDMFELKADMNRRAVNFLSSARLFLDQVLQRVGKIGGDSCEVKRAMSGEYDQWFEYRFMEALRNHVQHSGSAVHSLTVGGGWDKARQHKEFALEIMTVRRHLEEDGSFKKATLNECPEKVDLLFATRRYVESLSLVHDVARQVTKTLVEDARIIFAAAISKYVDYSKASPIGLTAYPSSSAGGEGTVAVFLQWDDVRLKLVSQNRSLKNLSKTVVASTSRS